MENYETPVVEFFNFEDIISCSSDPDNDTKMEGWEPLV